MARKVGDAAAVAAQKCAAAFSKDQKTTEGKPVEESNAGVPQKRKIRYDYTTNVLNCSPQVNCGFTNFTE